MGELLGGQALTKGEGDLTIERGDCGSCFISGAGRSGGMPEPGLLQVLESGV